MTEIISQGSRKSRGSLGIRRLFGRFSKLSAAAAIIFVGGRAITSEHGYIGTNNAVVSAQITVLRAPIEGYVAAGELAEGRPVERSSVVETVSNAKPNEAAVVDLQNDLKRLLKQRGAAERQRNALSTLLTTLTDRAAVGNAAQVARIAATIEMDRNKTGSAETRRDQLQRDYERKLFLLKSGNAASADVDRLRSDVIAATQEARAAAAATQLEVAARNAAQGGVLAEPGSNDVTYSTQRADEIRILLIQADRSVADLDAAAEEARDRLQNLQRHDQTEAGISAPITGMIWKVGAVNGERVSPGDIALELVDCSQAFIMASIPQYRMPDIAPGGEARFEFVGETSERTARVVSVESGGPGARDGRFAAIPQPEKEPAAIVTLSPLSMPNTASKCLVGRTARVLLPLKQGSVLRLWTRRLGLDQIWRGLTSS